MEENSSRQVSTFKPAKPCFKGSDNGAVVVPGKADESLLVKKIRHEHEPGMPYKGAKLPDAVIARSWLG